MPVSPDDVRGAYRFILGREPESEEVVRFHQHHKADFKALRADLLASEEFRSLCFLTPSQQLHLRSYWIGYRFDVEDYLANTTRGRKLRCM
jgi:hypothetical protein